jgi:bacterial translation initiation factor 2 (bIF-2)
MMPLRILKRLWKACWLLNSEKRSWGMLKYEKYLKSQALGLLPAVTLPKEKLTENDEIRIIRDGIVVLEGKIASLKRFKDDVKEVSTGYECGIGIEKYNDLKVGDNIEAFTMEKIER